MEIKVLRKQGWSLRRIAEEVGCYVNTVRRHLAAPGRAVRDCHVAKVPAGDSPQDPSFRWDDSAQQT